LFFSRTNNLGCGKKGVKKMGYIRKGIFKDGNIRFQGEIRLRGYKTLTATFGRKTDAKRWI